jgi:8-oxo-dGTP pyrophosphatase MutT (NUDIX family)
LILDDERRVLVVQPSYKPAGNYQLVGGSAEPDEPPHLAAIREGFEEVGLSMVPDTLLITDYVTRNETTGSVEGTNLVFLHRLCPGDEIILNRGGAPEGEEPELTGFTWLTSGELDEHCAPYQARRIRAAMAAAADPSLRGYRVEGRLIVNAAAA